MNQKMATKETQEPSSSADSSDPLRLRLQRALLACSEAVENGDIGESEAPIRELIELLLSVSDAAISEPENRRYEENAASVLTQIHSYLSDPNLNQDVIDALSFELPKAAAKFSGVSNRCGQLVDSIIDLFTEKCSARDLITIFCEAIDSYGKTTDAPGYLSPLLRGLSTVVPSIRSRHFELLKEVVPVVLKRLKIASTDFYDRVEDANHMFQRAIGVAFSIRETCDKLDGRANEQVRALLGIFILEIVALVSIVLAEESNCDNLVSQLEKLFPYCGLSYIDLVTGCDVNKVMDLIAGDDSEYFSGCFSHVKQGAALSVIWGHISDEVAQSAEQNLSGIIVELRSVQTSRWHAISMMAQIFSMDSLPWKLKGDAVNFLLVITERVYEQQNDEDVICSFLTPGLISALQALMKVITYSPDASLRKNAFAGLKRVLADNPPSTRLDILQVLVRNSNSSSMVAILLDCARDILQQSYCKQTEKDLPHENAVSNAPWCSDVLNLVEHVLRPPSGGPPSLPEQTDAVLSALNLYRYVLIAESTGGTNYTRVLSKSNLQKAYSDWLLPLRTLVTGMIAETRNDCEGIAMDIVCGLNPVEFVLYRCIELVEEKLSSKSTTS